MQLNCYFHSRSLADGVIEKWIRVMQLLAIIMLAGSLTLCAAGNSQQITFSGKNVPLKTILSVIKKQTGYVTSSNAAFFSIAEPVTIVAKEMPLSEFLDMVFKDQLITFSFDNTNIILKRKPSNSLNLGLLEKDFSPSLSLTAPPVTGIVRSSDGQPIAGANVVIIGTRRGTSTAADGSFSIEVKKGEFIIVSSVGFIEKKILVEDINSKINILLNLAESKLDEVQIIAYGITSRRTSTSTIGTIKSEDITKQVISDPLAAIQGRVAGVSVTPTSGNLGAKINIQIRGQNSLNFSGNPLYLVDNVPVDNDNFGFRSANGYLQGSLSPFSYINPSDIESISVLKDADATAIYGSRGANGVILITTKKGKAGTTKVSLSSKSGYGEVAKKIKLLNTSQYLEMRKEAFRNDDIDYTTGSILSSNSDLRLYDPNSYTDWQKVIIGGKAQFQDYQSSISGGNNLTQYIVGGNYHKETSVYPGSNNNQKINVHFNLTGNSSNNKLKVSLTGSYLASKMNTGAQDYTSDIFLAPNAPSLLNSDGTINWAINPVTGASTWNLNGNPYAGNFSRNKAAINNLIANLNLSYEVAKNLQVKLVTGYNTLSGSNVNTVPIVSWEPTLANDPAIIPFLRTSSFAHNVATSYSIEPQLTYGIVFDKSKLTLLAGASMQSNSSNSDYLALYGFTNDALLLNRSAGPNILENSNTGFEYKYAAVFARATYFYDNKYVLNVNIRRDGSSRFASGYQFGNFGSIAGAYIFSNESFIKNRFSILSFGKIKFSYGTTGNDGIGNYSYIESYKITQSAALYQNTQGYTSNGLINNNYHWETVKKMDFGLELGLIKDHILIDFIFFRNRSGNQLINYPIPSISGYGNVYVNLPANVQNTGLEINLNTTNIKSNYFSWNTNINFTRNRNKLISYTNIDESAYYTSQIGQPFYGVRNLYRSGGVNPQSGEYQFLNKEDVATAFPENSGFPYYGFDAKVFTYPKFYGGLSNTITYKKITLDFLFQVVKQLGVDPVYYTPIAPGNSRGNQFAEILNRWQKTGDDTKIAKFTTRFSFPLLSTQTSDLVFTDASFVRLKNIALSYNLSDAIFKRIRSLQSKVFFQGQNVYTFTKYKGLDPETQSLSNLPPLRFWILGLQLEF
jgi:TonB-dependent starch-binding outer membrane protein SusC